MNKKILSLLFGLAIIGTSCKKEGNIVAPDPTSNLVLPNSFTWQTVKDVNFSIGITDKRFSSKIHVISVYLSDPSTGAEPISKGAATLVSPFNVKLAIPTSVSEIYVVKTAPDGSSVTEKLAVTNANVSLALSAVGALSAIGPVTGTPTPIEPVCGISTSDQNVNINNSKDVVCYSSSADATINVNANDGGTLKINAPGQTITLGNFNHKNLSLYVGAGTTVAFNNDLNISKGETFVINGILSGSKINLAGKLINNKEVKVTNFTVNTDGELENRCKLTVTDAFHNNELVNNYKLINVGSTTINSTGVLNLYNAAMFQTKDLLTMDGVVNGKGTTSLFKTTGSTSSPVYDNNGRFNGTLQYCGEKQLNENQNNKNHFYDNAVQSCEIFIAKDDCNTIGNGTATQPDTDDDGVIDSMDDYPKDPTKAFNQKSPNYDNGGSTLAFEDSWPSAGDYDLNDVVIRYKILAVTNSKNKLVHVRGDYDLIATGGAFSNGFGVQFNFPASSAKNFRGTNEAALEAGQDSIVVAVFKDTRAAQQNWNTVKGEANSPTVSAIFSFDLIDGPELKEVGISKFNPFIWNNSSDSGRGHETHLRGKSATNLANKALFNTTDDATHLGVSYNTADNFPWGIEIPVAEFKYPLERANISEAYLKFSDWASSGGKSSLDWYSSTASGYRDDTKIY